MEKKSIAYSVKKAEYLLNFNIHPSKPPIIYVRYRLGLFFQFATPTFRSVFCTLFRYIVIAFLSVEVKIKFIESDIIFTRNELGNLMDVFMYIKYLRIHTYIHTYR